MWKSKVIFFLIASTTADAITNSDELSLASDVGNETFHVGGYEAQGVGDLRGATAPTMLHERFFPATQVNGALSEIAFASGMTAQDLRAALS
jgi:hypothetical protein